MLYDIIGDIHGRATLLEMLLKKLGYRRSANGTYIAQNRTAIFIGDLIDRGNEQFKTVDIVRRMCDEGVAQCIMGNHEYNAVRYATVIANPATGVPPYRLFLQVHNKTNNWCHEAFMKEFGPVDSAQHQDVIGWFKTLPLFIDNGFKCVHACWDPKAAGIIREYNCHGEASLTSESLYEAHFKDSPMFYAVKILIKGPETPLPYGVSYKDGAGIKRHVIRYKWWGGHFSNYLDASLGLNCSREIRHELSITPFDNSKTVFYTPDSPVFFGHYWVECAKKGPVPFSKNVVCVDYGRQCEEMLTAYVHEIGHKLSSDRFVQVSIPDSSEK